MLTMGPVAPGSAAPERRRLAELSPGERAGLLPLLRALHPAHPAWKTRPLVVDIARAALAGIERRDTRGFLALDAALLSLGVDLAAEELSFGTLTQSCGDHVLHLALALGADTIADALLDRGADPNRAVGPDGLRPLHVAVLADRDGPLRRLLAAGADPEAPDALGRSPRALAATVAWKRGLRVGQAILGDADQTGGA